MNATLGICTGSAQIIGTRPEQQDAFGFTSLTEVDFIEHGGLLAVVADGVGGHAHGREASNKAVAAFIQNYLQKPRQVNIPEGLYQALMESNRAVVEFSESQGESENCGTTLVAAVLHPSSRSLYWIGVGDSRLYFFRGGQIAQFTMDANLGGHFIQKVVRGIITRKEMNAEENLHKLTSFLGMKKIGKIDRSIRPFQLHEGDAVLLCTDGVYQALSAEELAGYGLIEPQQACDWLMQAIITKNWENQDNATAAMLAFGFKQTANTPVPSPAVSEPEEPTPYKEELLPPAITVKPRFNKFWLLGLIAVVIGFGLVWVFIYKADEPQATNVIPVELPKLKPPVESRKNNLKR